MRYFLSEMDNIDIAPLLFQVLGYNASMAAVRLILAAKQAPVGDDLLRNGFLNPPLMHQRNESVLIGCPIATPLAVVVQQLLRRREFGHVNVFHLTEFTQKIRKVVLLCETSELKPIVKPHVHDTRGTGITKQIEKMACGFSCEADGGDSHVIELSGFPIRFTFLRLGSPPSPIDDIQVIEQVWRRHFAPAQARLLDHEGQ